MTNTKEALNKQNFFRSYENPANTLFYSPEPRAEVYCLQLNFKTSNLAYFMVGIRCHAPKPPGSRETEVGYPRVNLFNNRSLSTKVVLVDGILVPIC